MDYFSYNNIVNDNNSTPIYNHNLAYNITCASSHDAYSRSLLPQDNSVLPYDPCKQSGSMQNDIIVKSDDELWTEAWLSKIGKIHINLHSTVVIKSYEPEVKQNKNQLVSIHVLKNYLKNSLNIIKQLRTVKDTLQSNVTSFSSEQWKKKTLEIGSLKNDLSAQMLHFESADKIMVLKKLLLKRKKKRMRYKQRKARKRELQLKIHQQREHMHRTIDHWLRGMKDAAERVKMEEHMKRDADCVLLEVNQKKSEARKHMTLINALQDLRNLRKNLQQNVAMTTEDDTAFNHATDRLSKMWEKSFSDYSKEKQGLKLMLQENAAKRVSKETRKMVAQQQWNEVLFGSNHAQPAAFWDLTCAEKNFETFAAIRRSWDTFLVPESEECGSRIPVGWVVPTDPSNEWSVFYKND